MDKRWQPPLAHPAASSPPTAEARGFFAAGWHAAGEECWLVNLADHSRQLVSPQTWSAVRELAAVVPAQLQF
jgi:hypothetical protein